MQQTSPSPSFGLADFPEAIIGCGRGGREKEIHDLSAVAAQLKLNEGTSIYNYNVRNLVFRIQVTVHQI